VPVPADSSFPAASSAARRGSNREYLEFMTDEQDDELVACPPSTLNLDRSASAVRSGRAKLGRDIDELTHTDAALTGGDVDADAQSAYAVGDEAPGGDNPTPGQDIVENIGEAVGLAYQDTEELGGERKLEERDRHRWELDPASSEDYAIRQREKAERG
jgi:hypothetical protein